MEKLYARPESLFICGLDIPSPLTKQCHWPFSVITSKCCSLCLSIVELHSFHVIGQAFWSGGTKSYTKQRVGLLISSCMSEAGEPTSLQKVFLHGLDSSWPAPQVPWPNGAMGFAPWVISLHPGVMLCYIAFRRSGRHFLSVRTFWISSLTQVDGMGGLAPSTFLSVSSQAFWSGRGWKWNSLVGGVWQWISFPA